MTKVSGFRENILFQIFNILFPYSAGVFILKENTASDIRAKESLIEVLSQEVGELDGAVMVLDIEERCEE